MYIKSSKFKDQIRYRKNQDYEAYKSIDFCNFHKYALFSSEETIGVIKDRKINYINIKSLTNIKCMKDNNFMDMMNHLNPLKYLNFYHYKKPNHKIQGIAKKKTL